MPKAWKNTGRRWSAKHGTPAKHTGNNRTPRGWRNHLSTYPSYLRHSVFLAPHSRGSATLHHLPVFSRPFRTCQALYGYKRFPTFLFTALVWLHNQFYRTTIIYYIHSWFTKLLSEQNLVILVPNFEIRCVLVLSYLKSCFFSRF